MPLLIIDGPEAVGKTTLISVVRKAWDRGPSSVRPWGPVSGLAEYMDPLQEDIHEYAFSATALGVWDRSWASEWAYNGLLDRGRDVSDQALEPLETLTRQHDVTKVMILTDPSLLAVRRQARIDAGDDSDLPVNPTAEHVAFATYADKWDWATASFQEGGYIADLLKMTHPIDDSPIITM